MKVKVGERIYSNPLLAASGIFSHEYFEFYNKVPFSGVVIKTHTAKERPGNPGLRITEIPGGMMNSIGLANPGITEMDLKPYEDYNGEKILSIAVLSLRGIDIFKEVIEKNNIKTVELNLSCPNIMGKPSIERLNDIKTLLSNIRNSLLDVSLWAKLSVFQVRRENALLLEDLGYNGITAINTLPGILVDINKRDYLFENQVAGMSGSFLFPAALKAVRDLAGWSSLPIIGCGGVSKWEDVVAYIMAGAHLVEIGSSLFSNPLLPVEILKGLRAYLRENKINEFSDIRGVLP